MKVKKFAEKVVKLAAEENLTVVELRRAMYIAKGIANNSAVEENSIKKGCDGCDLDGSICG